MSACEHTSLIQNDTHAPMLTAALFTTAKTWGPKCPSAEEWVKKIRYVYTMEYYSAIKTNESESVLVKWMNLEPIT